MNKNWELKSSSSWVWIKAGTKDAGEQQYNYTTLQTFKAWQRNAFNLNLRVYAVVKLRSLVVYKKSKKYEAALIIEYVARRNGDMSMR